MRAKRVFLCVGAVSTLVALVIVFGRHWFEREAVVAVAGSSAEGIVPLQPGPAEPGRSTPPDAALAAQPDCLATAFEPAASEPESIARRFFVQLGMVDARSLPRQLVADLAGVDLFAGEGGFDVPRLDLLLPPVAGEQKNLGWSRQRPLEDALRAPTLDEFIVAAHNEPALLRQRWGHFGLALAARDDSLLGHALRVRGGEVFRRVHEFPAASFGLHELAVAMAQGIDPDDFLVLLDRTDVNPKATWLPRTFSDEHHMLPRRYNLAALAAVYVRPRLLRALLERGVALPAVRPSALDELSLSLPATQPSPEVLGDVVGQLAAVGERPYLPSTAARLAAAAPGITVPGVHFDTETALSSPDLREHAAQLAALVARRAVEAEEARALRDHCRDVQRLAAVEASAARSLASKMAQDHILRERQEHSMRADEEQGADLLSKLGPDSLAFVAAMRAAFAADDWDEVFRILDQSSDPLPDEFAGQLVAGLLTHALLSGSQLDVVRELIARNRGTLPPRAILPLVDSRQDNAVHVAAELEAWGLDPGFVDADGRNAVNYLMDVFRSRPNSRLRTLRWLDYLTSRSVSTQPSGPGLDPLDTVLFAVLDAPETTTVASVAAVARALILSGASVQSSHREIADRVRAVAPDAYEELVVALPELRTT